MAELLWQYPMVGLPMLFIETCEYLRTETDGDSDLLKRLWNRRRRDFPFFSNSTWTTDQFRENMILEQLGKQEEAMRLAYAARSLSPSWWWYASDKRFLDESEIPHPAMTDKGEMCLGPTTLLNSLMFFKILEHDYTTLPDSYLRLAFGGMLGIWALVRADGAGSMGFCPDPASKQFGISALSGDLGISLFAYLKNVASYVLPTRNAGVITFGCHFEMETKDEQDIFIIRPWDGIGRRIVVRQVGFEIESSFGVLRELRFDSRKRWAKVTIQNPSDLDQTSEITVKGLWGKQVESNGEKYAVGANGAKLSFRLNPGEKREIEMKVTEVNGLPTYWIVLSTIFFAMNTLLFLAIAVILFRLASTLNDLKPKVEKLVDRVDSVATKVDGLTTTLQNTVRNVGEKAQGVAGTASSMASTTGQVFERYAPIIGLVLTGLKVLGAVKEYKSVGKKPQLPGKS